MRSLTITDSPHICDHSTTRRIMLDVIIALIPALIAATLFFGPMVPLLGIVAVSAAVLSEWVFRRILRRDTSSVFDLTAVITALIMVLGIPANTPIWVTAASASVAIIVVKQLFGGVGRNLLNPALVGHIVITLLVAHGAGESRNFSWLTVYGTGHPLAMSWLGDLDVHALASATPLQLMADGTQLPTLGELFLGIHAGVAGETSILAILLGGGYLIWRRVVSPVIPLAFIGTTLIVVSLAGQNPLVHLLSGSLVFVAVFMATDYATSPVSLKGKIVFGIGCGLITALIRLFGPTTEGVSVALLAMNLLVPLIDRITLPKAFGRGRG